MFFQTMQQFYGSSACSTGDIIYGPITMGNGLAPGGPYTLGVNSYRRWLFTGLVLKAGEYIRFYNSDNFTNLVFEKVGPFSGDWDTGCSNFTSKKQTQHFYSIPNLGCSENSDCPDGDFCFTLDSWVTGLPADMIDEICRQNLSTMQIAPELFNCRPALVS